MKLIRAGDLAISAAIAALVGAGIALIQPGGFWTGWAGSAFLLLLGMLMIFACVRWAQAGRMLAVMCAVAFGLRLVIGTALYLALPFDGYDEPDDRSGFVFTDAHRRDDQAWELASSGSSLISAFDRNYYTDQYGGLLALSALTYRALSPDAHRPLLILMLAALVAALGVPFFFRIASRFGESALPVVSTWLYCVYPESVLTGGAQMREPFLLTFIAIAWWGFLQYLDGKHRGGLIWLGLGFGGLVLISPGIAIALLVFLGVWLVLMGRNLRPSVPMWIGGAVLFVIALTFLTWSLTSRGGAGGNAIGTILAWFRDSVSWVVYQLERGSGQVQNVFVKLFPAAQFAFVVAYGVTQPLLPPAFLEPTTLTWHLIGIGRSVGWYLILPLLLYAPFAAKRLEAGAARRLWTWMIAFSWIWIMICSIRAGGDQWDNPRYRLIFFGVQALIASVAWLWWRKARDPWLPRIVAVEVICLLLFGQWYVARYFLIGVHLPVLLVVALSMTAFLVVIGGGALWDRYHAVNPRTKAGP
ncbi:MAG TPA: hypothetical protein VIU38_04355 [Anaerolineales bacterium]